METILGRIHSIESMGLVDGPGVRSVVFMQGCILRCLYCHNPDTWSITDGKTISSKELTDRLFRFKAYYNGGGGVTFSGGEPLLQPAFLSDSLKRLKEQGIHTCIDTSGVGKNTEMYDEILDNTDLVLFDVKHHIPDEYKHITGHSIGEASRFLELLIRKEKPLWIRHVVVPGLTDTDRHLESLCKYLEGMDNIRKVELLPYHTMGVHKYKKAGIPYPLEGTLPMTESQLDKWKIIFNERCVKKTDK